MNNVIRDGRAVGNSTRQIDNAVQELFNTGETLLHDHGATKDSLIRTYKLMLLRLDNEHRVRKHHLQIRHNKDLSISIILNKF